MNAASTAQERMDAAFENYFELSNILQADMNALLDSENDTQHWRRNFIRGSASLIEGYAHCLREMCAISPEFEAPQISKEELEVVSSERGVNANDRFKFTLRAAYKLFELDPKPDFGGNEWRIAQQVLEKRHLLMHPKTPSDLELPDDQWNEIREGVTWLMGQLFNFFSLLHAKHNG